jgi:hypothetical protein
MTKFRTMVALVTAAMLAIATIAPAAAVVDEAEEAFAVTWARTDLPVLEGLVDRTWMWGPDPFTPVITEEYAEHPDGERPVQYFDKARMEVNDPDAPFHELWFVTNGLLVVEMMTGMMQVGHFEFVPREPAGIHIAGDPGWDDTPTYRTYGERMTAPAYAEGAVIINVLDRDGNVSLDGDLGQWNVTAGPLSPETGHRTASVFWEFMNSEGLIRDRFTNETTTGRLFENPYYATGLPVTEAYWAHIMVDGTAQWVLTQAFERRVLTYTPGNEPGWRVESGNVGLHYYEWRYETAPPETFVFHSLLGALNDSGVSGEATLTLDQATETLSITLEATGLEPNQPHPQHLHGFDTFGQSLCPTPDMAGAGGLITFEDGLPAYGGVALDLAPTPTADAEGNIFYQATWHFDEIPFEINIETLPSHTIILHGMTVDGEYVPSLPVACGMITPDVGFVADLTGEAELPTPVETDGHGFATFQFPLDPTALAYNLVVYDLDDVTMAHIHIEQEDGVGPVVVWLLDSRSDPMAANGVIASGTFGDADFVGPLENMSMLALIEAIEDGRAYVNVHTETYPAGEIRGTIQRFADR